MGLKLGPNDKLMVRAWTATMLTRYPSYALGLDGQKLRNDGYFGYDEQKVQQEYQRRTNQTTTGEVTDHDLRNLGLLPVLLTTHGTGQPDPVGIGYPADMARRLLDRYWWQPVGNYPAATFPMNTSADAGEREQLRLISDPSIVPGPVAWIDYSQGSIVGGRIRNRIRAGTLRGSFVGAVTIGNPMRPQGHYAGRIDPGGEGIDPTSETASEPTVLHLASQGDLYTTCPVGAAGEWERAIFNIVFSRVLGKDSIAEQIWELAKDPFSEAAAACRAIWNGGLFIAQNPPTKPHVTYHLAECPGTGMTFYEYGIKHMRSVADARLERIASA